ncbi:MAG: DNA methyltransferase [Mycoplasmoidaceae bacterium]
MQRGGLLVDRKNLGWTLYYNESTKEKIPKMDYNPNDVASDSDHSLYINDSDLLNKGFIPIRPPFKNGVWQRWTWNFDKAKEEISKIIPKKTKDGKWTLHYEDSREIKPIPHKSIITIDKSSIKDLSIDFPYPKSENLILDLINKCPNKDAIILDFFAGSGTTGHSVMELNIRDSGNRKFILVTNNENNIAHNITYERLHRIIKGEGTKGEGNFDWLKNNKPYSNVKLRVIEIDDSIKISLDQENIDESIFNDCKNGLKLLDNEYNKSGLNLYYDLSALNPLEKTGE